MKRTAPTTIKRFLESLSRSRWAFLLFILGVAAFLRLWQLGDVPSGLYRDEAYNGFDALGIWQGQHALFFTANNGREPLYIYLTALAVAIWGRTAFALRVGAAVVGILTTLATYKLAAEWFGQRVGLLTAWLWAVTLWPMHLGRIGLRVGLMVPLLATAAWLATLAYRRQQNGLWLAAGAIYALAFYSYAAVRFTPALLVVLMAYLLWQKNWRPFWPGLAWAAVGFALIIAPLALLTWQQPEMILGRVGQVSILHPDINGGDLWGTLARQIGSALGLFFWHGDEIIRHNPAGRPLFDPLMAIFFVWGVGWCLVHWRRPAATAALLWTAVMLGPTIFAEDTPHFLRVAGILPATLMFPAIGLSHFAAWPKLAPLWRQGILVILLLASLTLTVRDYFIVYARQPDTGYLFEAAARDLAERILAESPETAVVLDERFWSGWPSVRFLLHPAHPPTFFQPTLSPLDPPVVFYLWPHEAELLAAVPQLVRGPAIVTAELGSWARGDLEPTPYPLFVRYTAQPWPKNGHTPAAVYDDFYILWAEPQLEVNGDVLRVKLHWTVATDGAAERPPLTVFVHLLDKQTGQLIAQSDAPPAGGFWPSPTWRPDLLVQDIHHLTLPEPYDSGRHQLVIGLYPSGQPENPLE